MKVLLVDNGTTLLEKLERLIPGAETVEQQERFSAAEGNEYDLIVLSGSSKEQLVGNESDFESEIAFIRTNQKPLIGICFGCELIVSAFGGELHKLVVPHKGIREIEITNSDLFEGEKLLKVYESHQWGMSEAPANFDVLAQSADGPEMIKHKTLPVYGLQFHPENFVDTTEGDELFRSLFSKISELR
jgi:GMP synthase-like glutamine amidotransferase